MNQSVNQITLRAVLAFFKDLSKHGQPSLPWPAQDTSGVYRYNQREYVVLRDPAGKFVAAYGIRRDTGYLRRLWAWPPVLELDPPPNQSFYSKKIKNNI